MTFRRGPLPFLALGLLASVLGACSASHGVGRPNGGDPSDLAISFGGKDDLGTTVDSGAMGLLNSCGDTDPGCSVTSLGPGHNLPFPLQSDVMKDPNEGDDGVGRDANGWLGLDQSHASFDYLYSANTGDWNKGTVSKFDTKKIREVARYFTTTCYSNGASGGPAQCDGTKGCCSADDFLRWTHRKNKLPDGPHQAVAVQQHYPSRTAIDFNGDIFVANRAFGGQSSVTKIANDLTSCNDRNGNGHIDTSGDVNQDGIIQTDCNGDAQPDDIASVKMKGCTNGLPQEFYGVDDECILWTTNTNVQNQLGRPLGLGPGAVDFGASDAWAGTFQDGKFFRIDGTTGKTKDEVKLPNGCTPYGLVVDASGYGWAPNLSSGPLCFFSTKDNTKVATARTPTFGQMVGYGVTLDRDQNIWIGGYGSPDAYRYTPDRSNGWTNLDKGSWVKVTNAGRNNGASSIGRGIAADSRTMNQYWIWLADNSGVAVRIPGSDLNMMIKPKVDNVVDGSAFPAVRMAGSSMAGIGVDRDQNIWGISGYPAVVTRALVDKNGTLTAPNINGAPMGMNKCPAADRCEFKDNSSTDPSPYTYSDFTGFGLRNFTRPAGTYTYVTRGCSSGGGGRGIDTFYYAVVWDADVPPNTSLALRVRVGKTPNPDLSWGPWTTPFTSSPADLRTAMPLTPFDMDNGFVQAEFTFKTMDKAVTPKLKSFDVAFKCITPS